MLSHLVETYARSPLVWLGTTLTTASHFIFKIAAPIVMTSWISGLIVGHHNKVLDIVHLSLLYITALLLGFFGDYVFIRESDRRYEVLVGQFYDRIISNPVYFFREKTAGMLGTLFRNHMDGTINLFRFVRADIIPLLVATVGPIFVLATRDLTIAAIFAIGVLLQGYLTWLASRKLKPLRRAALKVYEELSGVMGDQMAQLAVVRASANTSLNRAKVTNLAAEEGRLFWIRHRAASAYGLIANTLTAGCFAGILGSLAISDLRAEDRLQLAILSIIFVLQGLQAVSVVAELHQRWSERWEHAASSLRVLANPEDHRTHEPASSEPPANGDLQFRGVGFAYLGAQPAKAIFESLDLSILDGRHVAVTGKNGAGKSTLVNLLLRFDDIGAGEMLLAGKNLNAYSDEHFYRSLSYVPQDPKLFNTTLRENLYFFEPNAPAERVAAIFELTGIDHLIRDLPGGLDASTGEMGSKLSGGERKRVAIARALLRDARIYVFDESDAGIHANDAREIFRRVRSFLQGRTVFMITHSVELIDTFEDVLDVADGGVRWLRRKA